MSITKHDLFLSMIQNKFAPQDISLVKEKLYSIEEDKLIYIQSINFKDPNTMLIIAILLGWERFFLDDIVLGILKFLTCYGCFLWWLIDIFTAKKRTYKYNLNKFLQSTAHL